MGAVGCFGAGPHIHAMQPIESRAMDVRAAALGDLPEWDLSDLYPGRDSAALSRDLATLAADGEAFRQRYQGRLADLSGAAFGAAVATYERLLKDAPDSRRAADIRARVAELQARSK